MRPRRQSKIRIPLPTGNVKGFGAQGLIQPAPNATPYRKSIVDVQGIKVGHFTDTESLTGCTVVLCPEGTVSGVDVRGSAPGTRETDLMKPGSLVNFVNAILLSGGSAFGLDAASGVMKYLEENGIGYKTNAGIVPIVPSAIIFDLGITGNHGRPGPDAGYSACTVANDSHPEEGSVGAGTGATVGIIMGMSLATKGGVGSYSIKLGQSVVGALAVVNALGDVVDHHTGTILAGPRDTINGGFLSTVDILSNPNYKSHRTPSITNTTLVIVATNAALNKEHTNKLAQVSHTGMAWSVRPCHLMEDGDVVFALATGSIGGAIDMTQLCSTAALVVAESIRRAVTQAKGLGEIPSSGEL